MPPNCPYIVTNPLARIPRGIQIKLTSKPDAAKTKRTHIDLALFVVNTAAHASNRMEVVIK
jgi:hypothetical protein